MAARRIDDSDGVIRAAWKQADGAHIDGLLQIDDSGGLLRPHAPFNHDKQAAFFFVMSAQSDYVSFCSFASIGFSCLATNNK